jgi:putative holliday junction resolvase
MARTIGLDVGNRHIGVAVSDAAKIIARPVEVIDRKRQDALGRIAQYVAEQQADEIVVGYPWNVDGTAGRQAHNVEQFTAELRGRVAVAVRYVDERYSTSDAQEILSSKKHKGAAGRQQPDDAIAAAVILQRYLDASRSASRTPAGEWATDGQLDENLNEPSDPSPSGAEE